MELCLNKSVDFFRLHDIQNLVLNPILQCPIINYTFGYKKVQGILYHIHVILTCLFASKGWVHRYSPMKGFTLEHEIYIYNYELLFVILVVNPAVNPTTILMTKWQKSS